MLEMKAQDAHVDRLDPELYCILVLFTIYTLFHWNSYAERRKYFRMDSFTTQSKKLKTYVEKVSELILKGKLRLRQLK